ncbi:ADP-ribosylglycohydrolase [Calidifontibacter indicus]|uniref:ADP-ribosylglycohydrolase n=1 Tax=Calidifontibacter indicus TaxID=419650 RepID=A0A3D9UUK1_9MICO|nr:ADP-ribosylglycohydrolase [Calidifontibacter indicus]
MQLEPRPWFAANPLFQKRRGNPRATVEAVNDGLKYFGGTSKGVHGLLRAAPLCALALIPTADDLKEMVSLSVSLTHDTHYVAHPAIIFCQLLARLATSPTTECLDVIVNLFSEAPVTKVDDYFTTAGGEVDLDHLRAVAANGRAHRVLAAGMYLATCDAELDGAMGFAGETADGDGVAAVAGALIGASTGVTPWMDEQFAKHEYVWQIEVLVRDLFVVALTTDDPLVAMAVRYPGW